MILTYIYSIEDDEKRVVVKEIYNLYYKKMYKTAFNILKNHDDALDAIQDAFYNITATYEKFRRSEDVSTAALVHIYTKYAAINIYNRNKRHANIADSYEDSQEFVDGIADEDADVEQIAINAEARQALVAAIDQLDDMYRDVIVLKYFHGLKNSHIARVLGIDVGTVNSRIFRAKARLRALLGETFND